MRVFPLSGLIGSVVLILHVALDLAPVQNKSALSLVCFIERSTATLRPHTSLEKTALLISLLKGPDVWEFRWRESGPDGKRKQRRMVVGSIRQFADESAALRTITALRRDINLGNARLRAKPITVSELVDHYRAH
jgi:hypothetical protein